MPQSSYEVNNYGEVFTSIVTAFCPHTLVELGVLHGYSTLYIAKGLRKLGHGHLQAFDLFEDYPYNHGKYEDVKNRLVLEGVSSYVTLNRSDAFEVAKTYANDSVGFLHVDLSNNGEILKKIMEQWDPKMTYGGIILFEGGSEERDNIEWMKKYGMPSIKKELENNSIIKKKYILGTYLKFPSLTMLLRKG